MPLTSRALTDELQLGPFEKSRPRQLSNPINDEFFSAYEALHGSFDTGNNCSRVQNAVWVEVDGKRDCIRFYPNGLKGNSNKKVLIYFSGDVINRTTKGIRSISTGYATQSPNSLHVDMALWSQQAQLPTIFLARPGIFGSSGDHNLRRQTREIATVDKALDLIKNQYGIDTFIMAGQSGGGHIVASLLNRRKDISAAAISSGIVSVNRVTDYWDNKRIVPSWMVYDVKQLYDPIDEVNQIRRDPEPVIYIISDPEDHIVPFFSQLHYVRRLRAAGFKPQHVYVQSADRNRHVLARHARTAAALIARGESVKSVRRAIHELALEAVE
jgi:pimeloyl-ACP methyl ester carboxylesterase